MHLFDINILMITIACENRMYNIIFYKYFFYNFISVPFKYKLKLNITILQIQ
jgi:hypothetical protein